VIDIIDIIELPLNNQRLLDLRQIQHIWTHIQSVCDSGLVPMYPRPVLIFVPGNKVWLDGSDIATNQSLSKLSYQ
jgi:hypothetical protein